MLTPEDIKNLTEYQKQVFVTKEEFNDSFGKLEEKLSNLQTSADAIALSQKNEADKNIVLEHRIKKTETWIAKAGPKLDLEFKN